MKPITILIIPLMIFLLLLALVLFRRNKISFQIVVFWVLVWILTAVLFIFPDAINSCAELLGFNNRMFFVFTVAILVLLVMAFMNFTKNKQNELTLIKLIQHVSLLASTIDEKKEPTPDEDGHHHSGV